MPFRLRLVCNVTRIVLTGVLYEPVSDNAAEFLFHDMAGLFMCILGSGLLWMELQLLRRLFVPVNFDGANGLTPNGMNFIARRYCLSPIGRIGNSHG